MTDIYKGILAAFIATVVMSFIIVLKTIFGIMPDFSVIKDLSAYVGMPDNLLVGWLVHFIIGTFFWGVFFAILVPIIPGAFWLKGFYFGIFAWLLMMFIFMPATDHGLFAAKLGFPVTIATLILHLVHGVIMGWVFGFLTKS